MGIYNFQPRFVEPIRSGRKLHTIRAERVHPDKPGNILHLYVGLRTKRARLLMRVPCVKVEEIVITDTTLPRILIEGHVLDYDEEEAFARCDGFNSFAEMLKFWQGRLPFRGQIIHWRRAA